MLLPHTVCITIVLSRPTIRPPDCFIEMKVHVCELCSGCLHVRVAGCRGVILDKVKSRTVTLVRRVGSTMFTVTRARNHPPTFSSKSTAPNCIMLSLPFFFFFLRCLLFTASICEFKSALFLLLYRGLKHI